MAARVIRLALLLALAAAAPRPAAAQDAAPALRAELGRTRIYQGESVDYYVEVKNVEDPPAELELPPAEAYAAEFDRRSSNSSNFAMWVNGRRVSQSSWSFVYHWVLTPKRAGEIEIPAPELSAGGLTLRGQSLTLTVVEPEEQDLVIFDTRVERTGEYPLQPLTVVLRVFVKRLPGSHRDEDSLAYVSEAPRLTIPWVDPPDGLAAQSFDDWLSPLLARGGRRLQPCGFAINELRAPRASLFDFGAPPLALFDLGGRPATAADGAGVERLTGRAAEYFVYTLRREFTPLRAGTFVLGGATIKGAIIEDVKGRDAVLRDVFDVGKATVVRVADAPREGRPASFCGAFGQDFALAADLQPRRARAGDPLTYTLTLSGKGNVHQVDPPDLAADAAFGARFQVEKPTVDRERSEPVFTYSLRPLLAGVTEVPPASLSFFDVEEGRYVTISSEAIPIEVEEIASLDGADIVRGADGAGRTPLRRAEGLLGNVTDPREVQDDGADLRFLGGYLAALVAAYGATVGLVARWRRVHGDPARLRRRLAEGRARQRFGSALALLAASERAAAAAELRAAFVDLAADSSGAPAGALTVPEALARLADLGVSQAVAAAVSDLLSACDGLCYGGAEAAFGEEAQAVLEALLAELRARGRLR